MPFMMRLLTFFLGFFGIVYVKGIPPSGISGRTECATDACKAAGRSLAAYLDTSLDPCDDFYEYVCQRWAKNTTVSEERGSYGAFDIVQDRLELDLKRIFEGPKADRSGSSIIVKLRNAFKACVDESIPEARTMEALKAIMASVGIERWPHTSTTAATTDWRDIYPKLTTELGITPIFELTIGQDAKNVSFFTLILDQMAFYTIGRNELMNGSLPENRPIADAYKNFIQGAVMIMSDDSCDKRESLRIAEEIFKFEAELATMVVPEEKRRDHTSMYHKLTISQLQTELPQVAWLEFFSRIFTTSAIGVPVSSQDTVVIQEIGYYKAALAYLAKQERHLIYNYLGLQVLLTLGPVDLDKFGQLKLKLDNATSGITKRPERWKRCLGDLNSLADHAVGRMYTDNYFPRQAKNEMLHLVKVLADTFKAMLKANVWMDEQTRAAAIRKVTKISPKIGYPDWATDNAQLEKLYRYVSAFKKGTPYITIYANLLKNYALGLLSKVHDRYNKSYEWVTSAAVVNAFYDQATNEIVFPAGILQKPFYERGLPLAANMGAIGMVIGHEVTHGFDDEGSQYDEEGTLRDWWNKQAKQTFRGKAQCFVEQYDKTADEQSGRYLNGVNTQGENIADNGGLRAAYKAFQNAKGDSQYKDMYIPGWPNLDSDQLFFISNAMMWCTKHKTGSLMQSIQYDFHSPAKYRVNIPMSNMDEFAAAFSCKVSSRMNTKDKCSMW